MIQPTIGKPLHCGEKVGRARSEKGEGDGEVQVYWYDNEEVQYVMHHDDSNHKGQDFLWQTFNLYTFTLYNTAIQYLPP